MTSLALNQKDSHAIESAVRSAIEMVVNVLYRVNSEKMQEYHKHMTEKHKENQKLRNEVKVAEKELEIIRRHAKNLEDLFRHSDRPYDNQNPSGSSRSTSTPQRLVVDGNESTSMANWQSQGFNELQGGSSDYQNPSTNVTEAPGFSKSVRGSLSPSSVPLPTVVVKEEPSDMDAVYIKWEMSEQSLESQHEDLALIEDSLEGECGHSKENGSLSQLSVASVDMGNPRRYYWNSSTRQIQDEMSPAIKKQIMDQRKKKVRQQYSKRMKEKIYTDPERLQAYRERERRRYHQRKKLIADLPEETQRLRREAWRAAASRYRARKTSHGFQTDPTHPCNLPQNTEPPEGTWGGGRAGPPEEQWRTAYVDHLQDHETHCS
ncbi:uncharacterized protein [Osmerus mordax]|uniref:uncharacterized protein n=1 Tax=Osmerus mordax TaxID=8014 RepID=UPI00350F3BDF